MKKITLLKEILNLRFEIEILKFINNDEGKQKETLLNNILLNCDYIDNISILTEIYKNVYGYTRYDILLKTGNVTYKILDKRSSIQNIIGTKHSTLYDVFNKKISDLLKIKRIKNQKLKEEIDVIEKNFLYSAHELSLYEQTKIYEMISCIKSKIYIDGLINKDKTYDYDEIKEQLLYGIIEEIKADIKDSKINFEDFIWLLKYEYTYENIMNFYFKQYSIRIDIIEDKISFNRKKTNIDKNIKNIKSLQFKYGSIDNPNILFYDDLIMITYITENGCFKLLKYKLNEKTKQNIKQKISFSAKELDNASKQFIIKNILPILFSPYCEFIKLIAKNNTKDFYDFGEFDTTINKDLINDFSIQESYNLSNIKEFIKLGYIPNSKIMQFYYYDDKLNIEEYKKIDNIEDPNTKTKYIVEFENKNIVIKQSFNINNNTNICIVTIKKRESIDKYNTIISTYIDGKLCNIEERVDKNIYDNVFVDIDKFDISKYNQVICLNPIIFLNNNYETEVKIPLELEHRIIKNKDDSYIDLYTKEKIYIKFSNKNIIVNSLYYLKKDKFEFKNYEIYLLLRNNITLKISKHIDFDLVEIRKRLVKNGIATKRALYHKRFESISKEYMTETITYFIGTKEVTEEEFFTYRNSYSQLIEDPELQHKQENIETVNILIKKIANTEEE